LGRGHKVGAQEAERSDEQKWRLAVDYATESVLHQLTPHTDRSLAASAQDIGNLSWGNVILSRSSSSVELLWYFNDSSYKKETELALI
jgi:hypothetical protein